MSEPVKKIRSPRYPKPSELFAQIARLEAELQQARQDAELAFTRAIESLQTQIAETMIGKSFYDAVMLRAERAEAELQQAREERDKAHSTIGDMSEAGLKVALDYAALDTIAEGLAAELTGVRDNLISEGYDVTPSAALTAWQEHKGTGSGR